MGTFKFVLANSTRQKKQERHTLADSPVAVLLEFGKQISAQ
jgi:hypothetical protein